MIAVWEDTTTGRGHLLLLQSQFQHVLIKDVWRSPLIYHDDQQEAGSFGHAGANALNAQQKITMSSSSSRDRSRDIYSRLIVALFQSHFEIKQESVSRK